MEEYLIGIGINIILTLLKDPKKVAKFRKALIKVRDALNAAFPPGV